MDEKILNDFNLSLSNDAVFKHYYSVASNLSVLVSLILGEEVLSEDITYLSNEVIITPKVKKPRFDLRILIQNELNIDLEMQNNKEKYFKERVVYYFSSMIMNDIQEGESYHSNNNYLGIWLLNSNVSIFDNNSYYEEYVIYGTISKKEIIEGKYKILIIDLKKLDLCDNIVLREYLSMIESKENIQKNLDSSNDLIKKEAIKMDDYLRSKEAFTIALNTLKSELDYTTAIKTAKEEGIEQGIEQGLERGITQKQEEVIFKLYQKGKSVEEIADLLDLSIDEVRKILGK